MVFQTSLIFLPYRDGRKRLGNGRVNLRQANPVLVHNLNRLRRGQARFISQRDSATSQQD